MFNKVSNPGSGGNGSRSNGGGNEGNGNNGNGHRGNGRRRCQFCGGNILWDLEEDKGGRLVYMEKCLQCSRLVPESQTILAAMELVRQKVRSSIL